MAVIVQKFGGSALASQEGRAQAALRVKEARDKGYQVVAVVSASGEDHDPYSTEALLGLTKTIGFLPDPREQDLLLSCAATISSVLLVDALDRVGCPAVALTGGHAGVVTDEQFGSAEIVRIDPAPLEAHLSEGRVPVVAGPQGASEDGEITTLGRGGPDTMATALGVALRAEAVEIYRDYAGVTTVDPRLVPEARTLEVISYEELYEMSRHGARVVYPRAAAMARRNGVQMRVRSVFEAGRQTTLSEAISPQKTPRQAPTRVITGITHNTGLAQLRIKVPLSFGLTGMDKSHHEVARKRSETEVKIFGRLGTAGINVDLVSLAEDVICFTVKEDMAEDARRLLEAEGLACEVSGSCAKITLIGLGMQHVPGVLAGVIQCLYDAGVPVLQTADSEITISCLVPEAGLAKAVQALHEKFLN